MDYKLTFVNENKRAVEIDGKTVELNRVDPHGFWYFKWNTGDPPVKLQGAFTNVNQAIEFLVNYFASIKNRKAA